MKKCSRCGIVKDNKGFYKDKRKTMGLYSACRKCHDKYTINYLKTPNGKKYHKKYQKSYRPIYLNSLIGKYQDIKDGAKERNKSFYLSFKFFKTLWGKPCYYCGTKLKVTGIDRVNNKRGYYNNNVVPCCKPCNMKKGIFTLEVFLKRIALAR